MPKSGLPVNAGKGLAPQEGKSSGEQKGLMPKSGLPANVGKGLAPRKGNLRFEQYMEVKSYANQP